MSILENKKGCDSIKKIIAIIIILIILFVIIYFVATNNKIDYTSYESINKDYYIIDRTEECAEMLEIIYADNKNKYYLTCLKSATIYIINKETLKEVTLKEAIVNKLITIEELDKSSINLFIESIFQIRILGEKINLRVDHNVDSEKINDYQLNKGEIYSLLDTFVGENYTWYKIEYENVTGWFANNGSWAELITNTKED